MPAPGREESQAEAACLAKAELRRRALEARDLLPDGERARLAAEICRRTTELPELVAADTVMSFASFRSELDTNPLTEWILAAGKTLCLPRVLGPRHMAAYRIADPAADLACGAWDIPEPCDWLPEVDPVEIDLVLVPGSVFDTSGHRCGYGGGFYDSYLPLTRPGIPWIGLAFEAQLVGDLPCEAHDLAVTAIVTDCRVIRPG